MSERAKSWPDPGVAGLTTRRQAALQQDTAVVDPSTQKNPTAIAEKNPNTPASAAMSKKASTNGKQKPKENKPAQLSTKSGARGNRGNRGNSNGSVKRETAKKPGVQKPGKTAATGKHTGEHTGEHNDKTDNATDNSGQSAELDGEHDGEPDKTSDKTSDGARDPHRDRIYGLRPSVFKGSEKLPEYFLHAISNPKRTPRQHPSPLPYTDDTDRTVSVWTQDLYGYGDHTTSDKTSDGEPDKTSDKTSDGEPDKTSDNISDTETAEKSKDDKKNDDAGESSAEDNNSALEDPTANEKWKQLDFDLTFLDEDLLAAALESADDAVEGSVPGPLPAALDAIWQRFLSRAGDFVTAFSSVSRKMPDVLWGMFGEYFKLTRNPNIYNMWVKQWSLLNPMDEGESKRDYHRRYVDAYHEKVGAMTPAEKQELRIELLKWLHDYEKECADEAKAQGVGFKGMLDGKRAMVRAAQTVARQTNCVVWGVLVPQDVSDAKMVASGGSFSSHDGITAVMKEYGVNTDDLCGTISSIFGAKRVADRLVNNWTDEALAVISNKPEKDRRYWLRRLLLAIQNRALPIPSDKLDWKGNASCCIRRKIWYDFWPVGVDPPDVVGDNKYLEHEHNKLMEAGYKTMRNEPGYPHIQVKAFTDEQLSWRRTDWKRWCALPVYCDAAGKVLITVGDVMPDEETDIKLKGRVSRKRFTGPGGAPDEDKAKTAKRRRSEEDYNTLLIGGGSEEFWEPKPPPPKRPMAPRPGYEHVEEMDVDEVRSPSIGPSERSQSVLPGAPSISLESLQEQLITAQRQQFQQQQQMTAALQQLLHGAAQPAQMAQLAQMAQATQMPNINWSLPPLIPVAPMPTQQQQRPQQQQQQQRAQQQQPQLPPIQEWMTDGQGGFLPFNGN
ncbi:hypothetical protein EXIGLDRAFT_800070 [Exidia glandulosa HHB12029]|uniref:Uncharacterized protein n=1 Tax=Exidia glandulosa HHB12029 TaxID=1314781 RepID=A0A165MWY0_EXIGL|nr:hypothetical protein EXIGLDRAFT_800070 [Exidia glandulosa HHB12029]